MLYMEKQESHTRTTAKYSVSDIQDYFKYIIRKLETVADYLPIRRNLNQIQNGITCRIQAGYYLELLTSETTKLLGSAKSKITKDDNGENVPRLEITEVVLVNCNIVSIDYQQDSRVLYTFVPNKPFGELLDILLKSFIILKIFHSEFSFIEMWFSY